MKLNLGCGAKKIPGFVNIDINPAFSPDITGSVDNLDSFCEDNSVNEIVAYDILEHFDRDQIPVVLKNWNRKLKSGGTLFLRTPDLDRIIRRYLQDGKRQGFFGRRLHFSFEKMAWHIYSEHGKTGMGHKWGFNRKSIENCLLGAGFIRTEFTSEKQLSEGCYMYAGVDSHRGPADHSNLHLVSFKESLS